MALLKQWLVLIRYLCEKFTRVCSTNTGQLKDFIFINAATKPIQSGNILDPCTPKGYIQDMGLEKSSPSSPTEKKAYLSDLHPSGNFSECRSASLMLLRKGRGLLLTQIECSSLYVVNGNSLSTHVKPMD